MKKFAPLSLFLFLGLASAKESVKMKREAPTKKSNHIEVPFISGNVDWGRKLTLLVPQASDFDLLNKSYLKLTFPSITAPEGHYVKWVKNVGHTVLDSIELDIGGQRISRQYGVWLDILADLEGRKKGALFDQMNEMSTFKTSHDEQTLYVPLKFWFDEVSSSLPLVALQNEDSRVRFHVSFNSFHSCVALDDQTISKSFIIVGGSGRLRAEMMFKSIQLLDSGERSKVANSPNRFLIEQLDVRDDYIQGHYGRTKIHFRHPVTYIVFTLQRRPDDFFLDPQVLNFAAQSEDELDGTSDDHILESAVLLFNGQDRFSAKSYTFFSQVQDMEHFPECSNPYIYKYSFAIDPDDHDGFEDFDSYDNVELELNLNPNIYEDIAVMVYAVSHNVLTVDSGTVSLEF